MGFEDYSAVQRSSRRDITMPGGETKTFYIGRGRVKGIVVPKVKKPVIMTPAHQRNLESARVANNAEQTPNNPEDLTVNDIDIELGHRAVVATSGENTELVED